MTRLALTLLALALAGCAASNKGVGVAIAPAHGQQPAAFARAAAPADSLTIRWTLPTRGSWLCEADTAIRVHDRQRWALLRLNTETPPMYYRGCEADSACWSQVREFNVPDTVASGWGWPGDSCAARVVRGPEYTVVTRNNRGWSCWSAIRR